MSSQLEPRSLRALVCALALAGGCFNESGAASQDDSSPGTSSSGTGGPECGADVVLPAPLTEPYSEWFVAVPGPQGQDAASPPPADPISAR
ncbi:MAG: hypothetical protein K1X88_14385 [Nannocystaceae bacterium]|nr:hypothetical protein [Nannocystaceae bacterium]